MSAYQSASCLYRDGLLYSDRVSNLPATTKPLSSVPEDSIAGYLSIVLRFVCGLTAVTSSQVKGTINQLISNSTQEDDTIVYSLTIFSVIVSFFSVQTPPAMVQLISTSNDREARVVE